MTALTTDRATQSREGREASVPVAASAKVYAGSLVCRNASGYLAPGANTPAFVFEGVALEFKDNSSGANGDLSCQVQRDGLHRFVSSGLAITDIGKRLYISDDQTVGLTPGNVFCGILADFISATEAWVDIGAALQARRQRKKVSVPITLVANTTTYTGVLIVQEKLRVMSISLAAYTPPVDADGTASFAIFNYDASATAEDNLLTAATEDLEALTAKTPSDLTLTATAADLILDDGDCIFAKCVNNSAAIDTPMAGGVVTIEYEPMA